MLEVDACVSVADIGEADFHFTRFGEVRFITPLVRDLPSHDESIRRFPNQNASPVALAAVFLLAITTATDSSFQNRLLQGRLADVMRPRPPCIESRRIHVERPLHTGLHRYALPHWGNHRFRLFLLGFRVSTLLLNASSPKLQN